MSGNLFNSKALALLVMAAGCVIGILAFRCEEPTMWTRFFVIVGPGIALCSVIAFCDDAGRTDLVPDYLSLCDGEYLERDGFCFTVALDRDHGKAVFTVIFQLRYMGPAVARVALRPVGSGLATVSPEIYCGPAGFGVAKFPVAIPEQHQGKKVRFEVGVDVAYPRGKGRELRFRAGRLVRHTAGFHRVAVSLLTAVRSIFWNKPLHAPTTVSMRLPVNVSNYITDETTGHAELLWTLKRNGQPRQSMPREVR